MTDYPVVPGLRDFLAGSTGGACLGEAVRERGQPLK